MDPTPEEIAEACRQIRAEHIAAKLRGESPQAPRPPAIFPDSPFDPTRVVRCPTCGARVHPPCFRCFIRGLP